jgi:hypothetical protein
MSAKAKGPAGCRALYVAESITLSSSLPDDVIDDAMRLIDVMNGAIAQSADGGIIFLAGDIVVRFVEQFEGAVKAAFAIHVGIDRRMVFQILAIVDGGVLDFANGFVDLFNRSLFFIIDAIGRRELAQMSSRVTKVGERVQIRRMAAWFVGEGKCGAHGDKKHDYGAMTCSSHNLLWPFGRSMTCRLNPGCRFLTR